MNRRQSLRVATAASLSLFAGDSSRAEQAVNSPTQQDTFDLLKRGKKIPVIFDTDIGGDIDDTWALLYLINCGEFDIRLVATDAGMGLYRTRLAAKFLTACGRDEIPLAISHGDRDGLGNQQGWVGNYDLNSYAGDVHGDAVDAIIQTIHASSDPVTLICVGAVPNIAEALRRDPTICRNSRFVGMHGAIHVGYGGRRPAVPEANVRSNPAALREVLSARWNCSITPLDTCGIVDLQGQRYAKVYQSRAAGIGPLMENYRDWLTRVSWLKTKPDPAMRSTTLFDLVAVYMGYSEELLEMQRLNIAVEDDGLTKIAASAPEVRCAMKWRNLEGFKDVLVDRLSKPV
jgi:inosine-uridine nucleoside N-ribohydrolase